jgi:hypothetical protein
MTNKDYTVQYRAAAVYAHSCSRRQTLAQQHNVYAALKRLYSSGNTRTIEASTCEAQMQLYSCTPIRK